MSAYIVEDKTINRVVSWLSREVYRSSYLRQKTEEAFGISVESERWAETVGQAMFKLNIDGVNACYGDGEAKRFRELNYAYIPAHATTLCSSLSTKIQVLKSTRLWLFFR
jgi:hypothetical protein